VKEPGDHNTPFAIPARPGRVPGNPLVPGQLLESSDEIASFSSLAHTQLAEIPDGRTVLNMPVDPDEIPIDYATFTSTMNEASVNFHTPSVHAAPLLSAVPLARSLDETFISVDLLAEIAALEPSTLVVPRTITSVPELEISRDALPVEKVPVALPATPVAFAPSVLPLTPARSDGEENDKGIVTITPCLSTVSVMPEMEEAEEVEEVEEVDIAVLPTVPDAFSGERKPEEIGVDPEAFFAPFLKPSEVPVALHKSADPYLHLKRELAEQRIAITAAMDELLPLVYDNHREENQDLFAGILAHRPPLDDAAWGHAAFVLGAYGNYMYRNPLGFVKKLEIWRAQLWAVYYERSYRRKYLAQRCQQLIHFFQGCAQNPTFLFIALHDLETLYLYLEPGSLRKLQQMLQTLPIQPVELLQRIETQMEVAEREKAERMAKQLAPAQPKSVLPAQSSATRPAAQPGADKPPAISRLAGQPDAREEQGLAMPREARRWLGFLSEEQRRQFFASLRTDRLETINQLLLQARTQILTALRTELLTASLLDYQRPRKSVPMRLENRNGPDHDRFAEAFRLLNSPKLKDQQIALRMFEQNMRENIRQEHQQIAREWMLYARARVQGSTRVAPDWERDCSKEEASWEEIWNLACYHRVTNDLAEAMRVLTPGLNELDAPVAHLRLALICALSLLLELDQTEASALQHARSLLIHHLERWPHPLSCLAWLVLSYETPGSLRPLDQSRRLSEFQELLEYPVDLPDPRSDLTEPQVNALKDSLVHKTHSEEAWFLWLNDYAARRPHNFAAWQRLAETSERLGRLARAELALQHIAGIYYDLDYIYAQEGEEEAQAIEALRRHVEKLFEFYRRHEMQRQAWDSFESCYSTLNHLGFWDEQKTANRNLLALIRPFLLEYQRRETQRQQAQYLADAQDAKSRSEIRRSELSNNPTRPLEHFKSGRRVGIFVDYENIACFIPREEDVENVGQVLAGYAAQFGEVVCRWASASPRNLANLTAVRTGLEAAHFKIRYPRRELQFSASQKDLADYALLECINNASLNDRLDVFLVVSGDRDYYERIYSLLESGRIVRILANESNLSASYRELVQQRQRKHQVADPDESDFFIDNLTEVLNSLSSAPD